MTDRRMIWSRSDVTLIRDDDVVGLASVEVPVISHPRVTEHGVTDVDAHFRTLDITVDELMPKMTLKTLHPDDQPVVKATIRSLIERFPHVAPFISKVEARALKTRWGQYRPSTGVMTLTNYGRQSETYRDPELPITVAHEFGHALMKFLSGVDYPTPPKRRRSFNGFADLQAYNDAVREYNRITREMKTAERQFVLDLRKKISERFGTSGKANLDIDRARVAGMISTEFDRNPSYVLMNPEELIVQAFGHWFTGKHGPISDFVGPLLEEMYEEKTR